MRGMILMMLMVLSVSAGDIKIAVAANVSYAIEDLKKAFGTLYPETRVKVTLGGSGKLTAQIMHGAPYQIFMSANMKYPETLYADGVAITKPTIYAKGSLAYFSGKPQDFSKRMQLLNSPKIEKIAVANPKTAPYGKATMEAMRSAGVYDSIKHKFVYGESISQTVAYAVTATDIGFISSSSLHSPKMSQYREGVNWIAVNPKLYTPIDQGIVILKSGKNSSEVRAFYDFMLSSKAREILQEFGYSTP